MPIASIPPEPGGASPVRSREASVRPARRTDATPATPPSTPYVDRVLLGSPADSLRTMQIAVERVLRGVEDRQEGQTSSQALDAAGRQALHPSTGAAPAKPDRIAERFGAAPKPVRASAIPPREAAAQIVNGITGYIFEAWKSGAQESDVEDLSRFQEQVELGLEAGISDARDILRGLRALSPEVLNSLEETERLIRQELHDFFARGVDAAAS